MVKTRSDLKIYIKKVIEKKGEIPFSTYEIREEIKKEAPNIYTGLNRITKYIKATDIVDFDKKIRKWKIKTRP